MRNNFAVDWNSCISGLEITTHLADSNACDITQLCMPLQPKGIIFYFISPLLFHPRSLSFPSLLPLSTFQSALLITPVPVSGDCGELSQQVWMKNVFWWIMSWNEASSNKQSCWTSRHQHPFFSTPVTDQGSGPVGDLQCFEIPAVLRHCWLGHRKGIGPVKIHSAWLLTFSSRTSGLEESSRNWLTRGAIH